MFFGKDEAPLPAEKSPAQAHIRLDQKAGPLHPPAVRHRSAASTIHVNQEVPLGEHDQESPLRQYFPTVCINEKRGAVSEGEYWP